MYWSSNTSWACAVRLVPRFTLPFWAATKSSWVPGPKPNAGLCTQVRRPGPKSVSRPDPDAPARPASCVATVLWGGLITCHSPLIAPGATKWIAIGATISTGQ